MQINEENWPNVYEALGYILDMEKVKTLRVKLKY